MNKRQGHVVTFIILCFALLCALIALQHIVNDKFITLDRAQEINYIFEQHERGEIELTSKELNNLIKEYQKEVRE